MHAGMQMGSSWGLDGQGGTAPQTQGTVLFFSQPAAGMGVQHAAVGMNRVGSPSSAHLIAHAAAARYVCSVVALAPSAS